MYEIKKRCKEEEKGKEEEEEEEEEEKEEEEEEMRQLTKHSKTALQLRHFKLLYCIQLAITHTITEHNDSVGQ